MPVSVADLLTRELEHVSASIRDHVSVERMSPATTADDVDLHSAVFDETARELAERNAHG